MSPYTSAQSSVGLDSITLATRKGVPSSTLFTRNSMPTSKADTCRSGLTVRTAYGQRGPSSPLSSHPPPSSPLREHYLANLNDPKNSASKSADQLYKEYCNRCPTAVQFPRFDPSVCSPETASSTGKSTCDPPPEDGQNTNLTTNSSNSDTEFAPKARDTLTNALIIFGVTRFGNRSG